MGETHNEKRTPDAEGKTQSASEAMVLVDRAAFVRITADTLLRDIQAVASTLGVSPPEVPPSEVAEGCAGLLPGLQEQIDGTLEVLRSCSKCVDTIAGAIVFGDE